MEIDLLRLIKSLLKRWWFIGLLTLVFTVTVFVYTDRYITPLYTAYTTVYIQNTADYQGYISSGDLLSSQQLANTFRVLLRSNKVMELVAEQVDLGYSPAYLSSMVSAVSVNNTEVMRVSVTNENAQHAQAIANAVGEVASREITSFFNAGKVVVVDTAALPAVPSYPDTRTNTMTGALLGFLLACAIIILKELLDTRIKTESDLRRFTQLPLIGVIPNHSKHKRRLWGSAKKRRNGVLTAESLPIVGEAYRAVRTNLMFLMANKEYKTVLVTSASPSEGKTTTCTNLAITLAKANKKVLIIDSDMRNPGVHKTLTIAQTPGLSDILGGFSDLSCIHETDIEHLSVLTAGTIPPNPAQLLVSPLFGELIRALSQVLNMCSWILRPSTCSRTRCPFPGVLTA
jgi:capsular polysaccharide biosynthesis protein